MPFYRLLVGLIAVIEEEAALFFDVRSDNDRTQLLSRIIWSILRFVNIASAPYFGLFSLGHIWVRFVPLQGANVGKSGQAQANWPPR